MKCSRCKKKFKQKEVKSLSKILRYILATIFLLNTAYKPTVQEARAKYCKPCARILNLCLFFVAFLVVTIPGCALIQYVS